MPIWEGDCGSCSRAIRPATGGRYAVWSLIFGLTRLIFDLCRRSRSLRPPLSCCQSLRSFLGRFPSFKCRNLTLMELCLTRKSNLRNHVNVIRFRLLRLIDNNDHNNENAISRTATYPTYPNNAGGRIEETKTVKKGQEEGQVRQILYFIKSYEKLSQAFFPKQMVNHIWKITGN